MEDLKIEVGKKYKLRNGLVTEEIKLADNGTSYVFEAKVLEAGFYHRSILYWKRDGSFLISGTESKLDIIEENNHKE